MLSQEIWKLSISLPFLKRNGPVLVRAVKRRLIHNQPWAFSFNISDRCPIGCQCYWRAQERVKELTDEEAIAFFQEKRRLGYVHSNIIGGEPYVRPKLLEKVAGIIPFNWLVTSGTTPLRHLRNTTQVVSIDGAIAETHDTVRRSKGLYERILKNMTKAREDKIGPLFIHTVLNRLNYRDIEGILHTWSKNALAQGILVSTMTPIKDAGDNGMRLSVDDRIWIVEELHKLKDKYGNFLLLTHDMIDRLHPEHTKLLHPGVCSTASLIESYDAAGQRIKQCILSEKADCTECGCVVTLMSENPTKHPYREAIEAVQYFNRITSMR